MDVTETLAVFMQHVGMRLEQPHRQKQQIAEIEGTGLAHAPLVLSVNPGRQFAVKIIAIDLFGKQSFVFGRIDGPGGSFRFECLLRDVEFAKDAFQQPFLVLIVVNGA